MKERMIKMKRILSLILVVLMVLCLVGCNMVTMEEAEAEKNPTSMFAIVEEGITYKIVYHKETKVMYAVSNSAYNNGNFVLLVNADGTPMIYEGGEH